MLKNIIDKTFPINEYITFPKSLNVDDLTIKTNTIDKIKTSTDTKTINDTDIATTAYINKYYSTSGNVESLDELEGRITTAENNIISLDTLKYDKADIIEVQASINKKADKNELLAGGDTELKEWKLLNFTTSSTTDSDAFHAIATDGNIFVGSAKNGIYYSNDLIKWTLSPSSFVAQNFYDLDFGGGLFFTAGSDGDIYKSTDGINWSFVRKANKYNGCRYVNNKFLAVGVNVISYSNDCETWTDIVLTSEIGLFAGLEDINYFNGHYVLCGNNGSNVPKIAYFDTLETVPFSYTNATITIPGGSNRKFIAVNIVNNHLVAVGYNNYYFTSEDGISWTNKILSNTPTANLYYSSFYKDVYVACGHNSSIFISTDEINWTKQTLPTTPRSFVLTDIVESEKYGLICAGDNRAVISSKNPALKNININYLTSEKELSDSNHKTISAGYLNKYYASKSYLAEEIQNVTHEDLGIVFIRGLLNFEYSDGTNTFPQTVKINGLLCKFKDVEGYGVNIGNLSTQSKSFLFSSQIPSGPVYMKLINFVSEGQTYLFASQVNNIIINTTQPSSMKPFNDPVVKFEYQYIGNNYYITPSDGTNKYNFEEYTGGIMFRITFNNVEIKLQY